jgi:hypothetical protein
MHKTGMAKHVVHMIPVVTSSEYVQEEQASSTASPQNILAERKQIDAAFPAVAATLSLILSPGRHFSLTGAWLHLNLPFTVESTSQYNTRSRSEPGPHACLYGCGIY